MPTIPGFESTTDVRNAGVAQVYADPNAFGAQVGQALKGAGQSLSELSATFAAKKKEQTNLLRAEDVANNVANASIDFARTNAAAQTNAPPDGSGTMDTVLQDQRQQIEVRANTIKDPVARAEFRTRMLGRLTNYAENNVEFEINRKLTYSTEVSNYTLNGLENAIRGDASTFDTSHKDGLEIINSQKVPEAQKEKMRMEWTQRTAHARFQGALASAKTPEDFDVIAAQAKEDKWVSAFKPNEYEAMLTDISQAKKAFVTQADVTARAALDGAEARTEKNVIMDRDELGSIVETAQQSSNPITLKRAMRLQRDQQILERSKKLPAAELEARSNQLVQNGYPGVPQEVANASERVANEFKGVSSSYLANVSLQEYGVYFPKGGSKANPKFAPRGTHAGVDIRNIKPYVQNAATLAGEIYGAPLPILSGYRSQAYQNAIRFAKGKNPFRKSVAKDSHHTKGDGIDVSTAGMSGAQKGKLVDALLQAGFTGFGEYGTHIHADFRDFTTNNYNADTRELGWSKGSPEVIAALQARGYRKGVKNTVIDRGNRAQQNSPQEAVDYGKGVLDNSTSATGLNGFTAGTWLGLAGDPAIAQRVGIDSGLSEEQVLELRKDPVMSLKMTAVLAEQNRKALEPVLGRPANDAELYMAHFLGANGAIAFIGMYETDKETLGKDLMPKAAENNRGRFYDKAGKPYTVGEMYDKVATQFSANPSQVQFEDAQTYKRVADTARTQEKSDPITRYASTTGGVAPLEGEGSYAARAATALTVADLYSIPRSDMKPFTQDEAAGITKAFSEGDVKTKLEIVQNFNQMDEVAPGMAQAAFAQIGQKDTVYAHAGAVANQRNDSVTADTIIRGQSRLTEDKTLGDTLFKGSDALTTFNDTVDGALNSIPAQARNAIFEAAKAHYAETSAQKGLFQFDAKGFETSILKVIGGNSEGVGNVNGHATLLPEGVTAAVFDLAVNNMSDADLIKLSVDGKPPLDIEGDVISASDVSSEGVFVSTGGDEYKVRMADGNFLTTGDRVEGGFKAFIIKADADTLQEIVARTYSVNESEAGPDAAQQALDLQQQNANPATKESPYLKRLRELNGKAN